MKNKCYISYIPSYEYFSHFHPVEVVGRGSETQIQVV